MVRAFLVVALTYALAVVGVSFNAKPLPGGVGEIPALGGAFIVLLLTFTHGVAPVFFYSVFAGPGMTAGEDSAQKYNCESLTRNCFVFLHAGFWYGLPIFLLADLTNWLSPVWIVVDVLFSGHGRRSWVFYQHGSTSLALVLFLVCLSGTNLFPVGLLVVLFQAVLLTFMDWKGKHLWVKEDASER